MAAFNYNPSYAYNSQGTVTIGSLSLLCDDCDAKKWIHEPPEFSCIIFKAMSNPLVKSFHYHIGDLL
ncbi:Hypothetical predicted protein [Octopus vulgaris]|uniref:Uncharacterized protein n=1 Tax=Octopus vulgaris TaxID=6645 RepID=A0AA36F5S7_OCTVU|nr:Hypothetical predicted protein [Octopus vulgaris]